MGEINVFLCLVSLFHSFTLVPQSTATFTFQQSLYQAEVEWRDTGLECGCYYFSDYDIGESYVYNQMSKEAHCLSF